MCDDLQRVRDAFCCAAFECASGKCNGTRRLNVAHGRVHVRTCVGRVPFVRRRTAGGTPAERQYYINFMVYTLGRNLIKPHAYVRSVCARESESVCVHARALV